jgi:hypothetical protein
MECLSRWLVPVHSAAESARLVRSVPGGQSDCLRCHVVLRWNTLPFGWFLYKQTYSWPAHTTHYVRADSLRLLHWENCMKNRNGRNWNDGSSSMLTFTRTWRSKHIAESSVCARTKKRKTVFPYFLKTLCSSRITRFFSLSVFLLSNTHQPFSVFCVTYCKGNAKSGTTEGNVPWNKNWRILK